MAGTTTAISQGMSILAAAFLLLGVYIGVDPFGHKPMRPYPGYRTYPADMPDWAGMGLDKVRDAEDRLQRSEIKWFREVQGPESVLFDPKGRGPYTGVADGRVIFWDGEKWNTFAVTSPNRSEICATKANPFAYLKTEHICGRPLGLRFDKKTGDMYIADAYFGILKVGPEGGQATQLIKEVEGKPLKFTNDLDVDDEGNIYFTESSTNLQRRNYVQLVFTAEPSGRLLKFSQAKNETTVLVSGLQNPNGVTLSKDQSFVVFTEGVTGRLSRYWLKGEKAGTSEIFVTLPGHPDNVRTNDKGEFWVAIHCYRTRIFHEFTRWHRLRSLFLRLPIKANYIYMKLLGGKHIGMVLKYSPTGELIDVLEDREGKVVRAVSEVEEHNGKLWIGSVLMPFIAVYDLN